MLNRRVFRRNDSLMGVYVQEMKSMASMTGHERQMVIALCARIADEKNPVVFRQLLIELDALLEKLNVHQATRTGFEGENMATLRRTAVDVEIRERLSLYCTATKRKQMQAANQGTA
jgi:hypothetical protein